MDENELQDLQREDAWVFEEGEASRRSPARKARAVVSVAFPADDFERVDTYAEDHNLKISELIRRATLLYVSGASNVLGHIGLISAGGQGITTAYFPSMMSTTAGGSPVFEKQEAMSA